MKMKKTVVLTALCVAFCFAAALPAIAVEMAADAARAMSVPTHYATVKDGQVVFGKSATQYSPDQFDKIMNAYGLELTADAAADLTSPVNYAKVRDGQVVFGKSPTAYSSDITHDILTAYGLCLDPADVTAPTVPATYAKVSDGQIVFDKKARAFSPDAFNRILGAYELCQRDVVAEPGPDDSDGDGVPDNRDQCPNTPRGVRVDADGCPLDSDGDGVPDYLDRCPDTPRGTAVDAQGCPLAPGEEAPVRMDSDGDGVYDDVDQCPGTPRGAVVNDVGCWVVGYLLFDYDKSEIRPQYYSDLDQVVRVLEQNPGMRVEIQGHTDNIGSKNYNLPLSQRRAKAVEKYLIRHGISASRLESRGYWFSKPVVPNTSPENRQKNRRVEIHPIY